MSTSNDGMATCTRDPRSIEELETALRGLGSDAHKPINPDPASYTLIYPPWTVEQEILFEAVKSFAHTPSQAVSEYIRDRLRAFGGLEVDDPIYHRGATHKVTRRYVPSEGAWRIGLLETSPSSRLDLGKEWRTKRPTDEGQDEQSQAGAALSGNEAKLMAILFPEKPEDGGRSD